MAAVGSATARVPQSTMLESSEPVSPDSGKDGSGSGSRSDGKTGSGSNNGSCSWSSSSSGNSSNTEENELAKGAKLKSALR